MRKAAAHWVVTPTKSIKLAVVVIEGGQVTAVYPFLEEQPATEWLGGTITVKPDAEGILRAYHEGELLI